MVQRTMAWRLVIVTGTALLLLLSTPAWSQAIPADAAATIAAALHDDQQAQANAAMTSSVFRDVANPLAVDNARVRATSAALSSAVVASIAAHPAYAKAIVDAAVAAAPAYGSVIVERASAAFPGFAPLFGEAPPYATPTVAVSQAPQLYAPMVASAVSETAVPKDPFILGLGYLESHPVNAARVVTAPLQFDRQDWVDTAVVVGVGGGLMLLDSSIRDFVQDDLRGSTTDDLADVVYHFGSFYTLATGLGA
ncbi:MAG: hypothetical protein VYA71_01700, partial [Pseudomonadota bacterium]|nr:hypothetical protein [Pseudomonadota bacterium]